MVFARFAGMVTNFCNNPITVGTSVMGARRDLWLPRKISISYDGVDEAFAATALLRNYSV